ncbi:MAG: ABC transporter permease [Betaproteobacteria bacterium HGW-Betaproteobacteria-13]|nr:MAG: ABC transporter permease [Betaproteobacteria bacterium HGW-Betaproteobacteria-13]
MTGRRRRLLVVAALLVLVAALTLAWALIAGSLPIAPAEVLAALGGADGMSASVVRELRLPRAVATFVCGGLLALAGALMQVLLRNPLADPYILGISGGAAVGALTGISLGAASIWIDGGAFAGALIAMLLVFGLAHGDGSWTQTRLLPDTRVQSMLFWLMGDASGASNPWPALGVLLIGLLAVLPFARDLNVLARGEMTAHALGVSVKRLRLGLYVLASLLTAVAVTQVGSVGFVGLIVPHLVRLALGNDQRVLLPTAAVAGGILLTVADTLARTVMAPQQLPVGVLTALIGVPVFLFLLARHPR